MSFRPTNCAFIAAALAVLLTGCSVASDTVAPTAIDSPAIDEPIAEETVAPPKSITWEASCMLSVDEVSSIMSDYNWQPLPEPQSKDLGAGDTECDYRETNPDSYRHISIDFRQYDPVETYGWVSPNYEGPGFAAPNSAEGGQNACDTATAAQWRGFDGICTLVGDTPVVIGANRASVVIFPEGSYFYHLEVYGTSGVEHEEEPLLAFASLLATRSLVSN
ncbi:hypothetical protein FB472_1188 [Rhodoglobus vestalii]|uniref:DUF3558 domain-containing protein n=1 Tax=Rhodoglobus vestalii TaxID=193384 RepID=A0A8H2K3U3_9MICO|nr:hypothetical protein [Rhodoglobus vestalii]TQO19620.1 hypothetical protein FB472_1188 [Rhodoglobus vestalii]